MTLRHRVFVEGVGAFFLLVAVVGSGIMGSRLAEGDPALTLLANSLATGGVLLALIAAFGPISGAHFNPAISAALASRGAFPWNEVPAYLGAQTVGAFAGCAAANTMFGLPALQASHQVRAGIPLALGEVLATFGLVAIVLCSRATNRTDALPWSVAAYVTGAYWFTSSTGFANPAVTLARMMTDSFTGIRPSDTPPFLLAQLLGATAATAATGWMFRHPR
jgi:glycerol uptake facilitator-like aquaporin